MAGRPSRIPPKSLDQVLAEHQARIGTIEQREARYLAARKQFRLQLIFGGAGAGLLIGGFFTGMLQLSWFMPIIATALGGLLGAATMWFDADILKGLLLGAPLGIALFLIALSIGGFAISGNQGGAMGAVIWIMVVIGAYPVTGSFLGLWHRMWDDEHLEI